MSENNRFYKMPDNTWVPSVTTILRVVNKPQLEEWKTREAMAVVAQNWQTFLTVMSYSNLTPEEVLKDHLAEWLEQSKAKSIEAAAIGTNVHNAINAAIAGAPSPEAGLTELEDTLFATLLEWREGHVVQNLFHEELVFGQTPEHFGSILYGGRIDSLDVIKAGTKLGHSGRWLVHDETVLVDVKVSDGYYDSYGFQLAAYMNGVYRTLGSIADTMITIRLDKQKPTKVYIKEWGTKPVAVTYFDAFCAAALLWQAENPKAASNYAKRMEEEPSLPLDG